ncbi:hypothetical protein [uncultured Capnocytophaga sp.]|jgi:hypothetical protein|uniref:hypothetical protein n=1 Tax=uncultured Capnocytophaga sp. TaxID=159273 RepID=UPI00262B3EE6|nr:hypothetical protein [uncultured Capnocytophaga sp.]
MELSKKELEIFEKINLYDRYRDINNLYRFEETFENYSNDEVIKIVKELGYTAKYRKKENFFQIIETINEMRFYFHFSLKYGMVEVIIFWEYENNKDLSGGGLLSVVCKLIEIAKNEEKEGYIKDACFRNYEDLKNILREYFLIYEDLKISLIYEKS